MKHHVATKVTDAVKDALRNDPALRAVYRAKTLADLTAMVDAMGITDPQHKAMMLGLLKLAWLQLRRLA